MDHRKISSVMTPAENVVSVQLHAGFKEIAEALEDHGISAVPVVDDHLHVVGVVSEDDLLAKEARLETGTEEASRLPFVDREDRRALRKAAGLTALDLMTAPPVTIGPQQDVVEAARLMADTHLKRLFVVDPEGRLRGVVSRRDVLKVFTRADEDIRREVVGDVLVGMFGLDPAALDVGVQDGVVSLRGRVVMASQAELIRATVRRTDGVVDVVGEIEFDHDDVAEHRGGVRGIFHWPGD
jgi:CBS domain-containing protein